MSKVEIEVGEEVKILPEFNKFTVVAINGNIISCKFEDSDGFVGVVNLPKNILGTLGAGFLDSLL
ncbi:hypothetical protein EXE30_06790 [Acinetobacter halotolerans]|uniref:Uncharacterized protein n=1 Tax=Acinetobacter halotolerans TaxID=1752076 RepID=A0A4Q6XA11_9GAMM|nr:hypothetical protein [Acinetobacter halotolerans]RZF53676.1 hypothetical protein EXE30_06790 [Acinetobacter halotolerans]